MDQELHGFQYSSDQYCVGLLPAGGFLSDGGLGFDGVYGSAWDAASMVGHHDGISGNTEEEGCSTIRAKIASHPLYPNMLHAYLDCRKVGATPEMGSLLDEIRRETHHELSRSLTSCLGADPELDHFMETYCEILVKYKTDLSRPFEEATTFFNQIETQFNSLCNASSTTNLSDEAVGSSDEGASGGEADLEEQASSEDRQLKDKLLRKYSGGYISSLKHEFSKKKKKGKLPKEARQILLNWWDIHYKWPYPTEADKMALGEATGLDLKQINNWFINQRKRHWKPCESMQFAVVDTLYGPFLMKD